MGLLEEMQKQIEEEKRQRLGMSPLATTVVNIGRPLLWGYTRAMEPIMFGQQVLFGAVEGIGTGRWDRLGQVLRDWGSYMPFGARPSLESGYELLTKLGVEDEAARKWGGLALDLFADPLMVGSVLRGIGKVARLDELVQAGNTVDRWVIPSTYYKVADRASGGNLGNVVEAFTKKVLDIPVTIFGTGKNVFGGITEREAAPTVGEYLMGRYIPRVGQGKAKAVAEEMTGSVRVTPEGDIEGVGIGIFDIAAGSSHFIKRITEGTFKFTEEQLTALDPKKGSLYNGMNMLLGSFLDDLGSVPRGVTTRMVSTIKKGEDPMKLIPIARDAVVMAKNREKYLEKLSQLAISTGSDYDKLRRTFDAAAARLYTATSIVGYKLSRYDDFVDTVAEAAEEVGMDAGTALELVYKRALGETISQPLTAAPQRAFAGPRLKAAREMRVIDPARQPSLSSLYRKQRAEEIVNDPTFNQNIRIAAQRARIDPALAEELALSRLLGANITQPYRFVIPESPVRSRTVREGEVPGEQVPLFKRGTENPELFDETAQVPPPPVFEDVTRVSGGNQPIQPPLMTPRKTFGSYIYDPRHPDRITNDPKYREFFQELDKQLKLNPVPSIERKPSMYPERYYAAPVYKVQRPEGYPRHAELFDRIRLITPQWFDRTGPSPEAQHLYHVVRGSKGFMISPEKISQEGLAEMQRQFGFLQVIDLPEGQIILNRAAITKNLSRPDVQAVLAAHGVTARTPDEFLEALLAVKDPVQREALTGAAMGLEADDLMLNVTNAANPPGWWENVPGIKRHSITDMLGREVFSFVGKEDSVFLNMAREVQTDVARPMGVATQPRLFLDAQRPVPAFSSVYEPYRAAPTNDKQLQQFFDTLDAKWKQVNAGFTHISPESYIRGLHEGYMRRVFGVHADPQRLYQLVSQRNLIPFRELRPEAFEQEFSSAFGKDVGKRVAAFVSALPTGRVLVSDIADILAQSGVKASPEEVKAVLARVNPDLQLVEETLRLLDVEVSGARPWTIQAEFARRPATFQPREDLTADQVNALVQLSGATESLAALGLRGAAVARAQDLLIETYGTLQKYGLIKTAAEIAKANPQRPPNLPGRVIIDDVEYINLEKADPSTWGDFAGKWIPTFVAREIGRVMSLPPWQRNGWWSKLIGAISRAYLSPLPTAIRNAAGNVALLHAAGIPLQELVPYIREARRGIVEYQDFGFSSKFAGAEDVLHFMGDGTLTKSLRASADEYFIRALQEASGKKDTIKALWEAVQKIQPTADPRLGGFLGLFQMFEDLTRGTVYLWAKDKLVKKGLSEEEAIRRAAHLANNAVYDYSSVGIAVDFVRRSGIVLFPAFAYFTVGRTARAVWERPASLAFQEKILSGVNTAIAPDPEERNLVEKMLLDYWALRHKPLLIPANREKSEYYLMPTDYLMPHGLLSNGEMENMIWGVLSGGALRPVVDLLYAWGGEYWGGTRGEPSPQTQRFKRSIFLPDDPPWKRIAASAGFLVESYAPGTLLRTVYPQLAKIPSLDRETVELMQVVQARWLNVDPIQIGMRLAGFPSYRAGGTISIRQQFSILDYQQSQEVQALNRQFLPQLAVYYQSDPQRWEQLRNEYAQRLKDIRLRYATSKQQIGESYRKLQERLGR